jgi:hypothetical protein
MICGISLADDNTNEFGYLNSSNYTAKTSDTMKIGDIVKSRIDLKGKIVKAKIANKYLLTQIAESTYLVQLYSPGSEPALAIFSKPGFPYINSFSDATSWNENKSYCLYIYIPEDDLQVKILKSITQIRNKIAPRSSWRFSSEDINNAVIVIGRKMKQDMGNSCTYSW